MCNRRNPMYKAPMTPEQMVDRAAPIWPRLMADAGIAPDGAVIVQRMVKNTPTLEHLILRLRSTTGQQVIFKQIHRPDDASHFAGIVSAQDSASRRMGGHPFAQVPAILSVDQATQSMLMEKAPGETVQSLVEKGADPTVVLRDAGRWMAAFHRDAAMEKRPFRPHFMADHLGRLAAQINAGEKRVPARADFQRHVATLRAMAPAFAGKPGL